MDNNLKPEKPYQGFLDTFCIRTDQIPMYTNTQDSYTYSFYPTNYLKQEKTYITFEGYINFNVNGITYVSRDCDDIRTYLESLGYKKEEGFCILIEWYSINKIGRIYPIDSHIFRLYLGLSLIDHFCPTLLHGKIGKNESEIKQSIEKAKREEPIFNDELWLKSNWRKYCQIEKDRINFNIARQYILQCINNLGYQNVYIPEILDNPEDIVKIINYFQISQGKEPNYVLSNAYLENIPKTIKENNEKHKDIVINHNYKILIDTSEDITENTGMLFGPSAICYSEEELWESLYKLLGNHKIR